MFELKYVNRNRANKVRLVLAVFTSTCLLS